MLSEDQIDYLFQIKGSKPPIPDGTVKMMLTALRWTPEQIKHAITFLNRAPEEETPEAARARFQAILPETPKPSAAQKPVVIKQDPFPLGSPFLRILKEKQKKKHKILVVAGAVAGAIVFIAGIVIYSHFAG